MHTQKLWTKDFLILALVNFFVSLSFYLLMVIISVYAMDTFNSPPSEAGLASSIFVIGTVVARLFCGKWIEQLGRKKMLFLGLIAGLFTTLLYFGVNSILYLLVIRFLHGAAFGVTSTATGTIIASIIPKERRGEGIGYYMLSVTLATAIGPFLGMFMNQHTGFSMIFVACTIFAAFSLVSALFVVVPEIKLTAAQLEDVKGLKFSSFFEPKAIPISVVCAFIYICYSSVLSFLTPYSKEIHLLDAASYFFIVYAALILISRPFTGKLFDARGENIIMYPAILAFVLGMAILGQVHQGYSLWIAAALLGLGLGTIQSSSQAIALKVTPPHRMGLANSTFFMFVDFGIGVGPFLLGLLIPVAGYRGMYLDMALVALGCMFLYYVLHGKVAVKHQLRTN